MNNNKKISFLSGFYRCGNTLLRSILNQNPNFLVTPNSIVVEMCYRLHLVRNTNLFFEEANYTSFNSVLSQVHKNYYQQYKQEYILEQGRWGTPYNYEMLRDMEMLPAKFVFLVRPLKEILASWLKFDNVSKDAAVNYCHDTMNEFGRVGQSVVALEHLLQQNASIHFIKYHELCRNPKKVIKDLYNYLEIPFYNDHYYENLEPVENETEQMKIRTDKVSLKSYDYDSYVPPIILNFYSQTDELLKKYST